MARHLEVPGVEANDFNVEFKNGELWITGEKKFEEQRHRLPLIGEPLSTVLPLKFDESPAW